jgi:hypothetical protein
MKDLSLHILDVLLNSAEASAKRVELEIKEDLKKDFFSIKIEDNGKGMDNKQALRVCDPFYTTRYTRKVGLGLPLLKMKTEECEGFLEIKSCKNKGTKVYAEFKHSHWDRPPLGDIASSICSFLLWEEPITIIYTHYYNNKRFCFNSDEFEKKIAPVSIKNIKILKWIKNYINSGIKNIKNG